MIERAHDAYAAETPARRCRPTALSGRLASNAIRHLLRASAAPPLGCRQRIPIAARVDRADRARRHARLSVRLGGRAPLPRGVLALVRARSLPRCGEPANTAHPPRSR